MRPPQPPRKRGLENLILDDRGTVLPAALLLTLVIAAADTLVVPDLSLAALYIVPIVIAAGVMKRWEITIFAVAVMLVREEFGSFHWDAEVSGRMANTLLAYLGTGLIVSELAILRRRALADATELAEQVSLRKSAEEQLRSLIGGSPAAILTIDPEGNVQLANEAAHRLFGCSGQNLAGQNIDRYLPSLATVRQTTRIRKQVRTTLECTGYRGGTEPFLAYAWLSSYPTQSGTGLAAVVFDGSEQLRESQESLLHTVTVSARVAMGAYWHEVRNLSSALAVVAKGLRRFPQLDGSEDLKALEFLIEGVGKLAAGELHPRSDGQFDVCDSRALLDHFRIIVEPSLKAQEIRVHWDVPADLPPVRADHHALLQVFLNLVRNGAHAAESSGRRELAITAALVDGQVSVQFSNTGVPVAHPDLLFKPFQPMASGSGLGLYISRAMVRSFGGEIRYEPVRGGSCFSVLLEVAEP